MNQWLRYAIAFVVACHGLTYLMFGFLGPAAMKEWGGSRILRSVLSMNRVQLVIPVAHATAGIAIIATGIAIAVTPLVPGLWSPLAIVGGAASIAAFAAFWDGRSQNIVQEGGIGLGLSAILVLAALAWPRLFG